MIDKKILILFVIQHHCNIQYIITLFQYQSNEYEIKIYNFYQRLMIPLQPSTSAFATRTSFVGFTLTAVVIFLVVLHSGSEAEKELDFVDSSFKFQVYCPIASYEHLNAYKNFITNSNKDLPLSNVTFDKQIYVVYIDARKNITDPSANAGLYYCGLARSWLGTCDNSEIVCSSPGPMFYMQVKKPAYIIWINSIDTTGLNWQNDSCYNESSDDSLCTVRSRLKPARLEDQSCVYQDPTYQHYKSNAVRIDRNHVPLSPHIHGLSNRPVFDGNPLSWFNNVGDYGIGHYSLDNPLYFQQFQNVISFEKLPKLSGKHIKIMHVPNDQPAGLLFYHDHAMKSTKYNVKNGLDGLYVLYDPQIDNNLTNSDISRQKFIVFSALLTDARDSKTHNSMSFTAHYEHIYTLDSQDIYERNIPYRFRVLNGHFDNLYNNISFAVYYQKDSKGVIAEIDPTDPSYNLLLNKHQISFTIIGADSTIFHSFIKNQTQFDLGVAERIQLLIKLSQNNGVPKEVNNFYMICFDAIAHGSGATVLKYQFRIRDQISNIIQVKQLNFSTTKNPFTNLSIIPQQKIAVKRMRPLFSLPREKNFIINGHYMFDMGASDKPQIGTFQDWYIINTLEEPHPIHFHLVNFQVIQSYTLKMVGQCTLYEIQFYMSSRYSIFNGLNASQICDFILHKINDAQVDQLFHLLEKFNLQNKTISKISGFNVLQKNLGFVPFDKNCPLGNTYRYICSQSSNTIPEYYRRWKDTASIASFSVYVFRVRWTMTEYNQKVSEYPYFNIPQDQLMEFPGFLYHCHILPHEDNEMMRPYMLQPSKKYVQNLTNYLKANNISYSKTNLAFNWTDKSQKINKKLGCKEYL